MFRRKERPKGNNSERQKKGSGPSAGTRSPLYRRVCPLQMTWIDREPTCNGRGKRSSPLSMAESASGCEGDGSGRGEDGARPQESQQPHPRFDALKRQSTYFVRNENHANQGRWCTGLYRICVQ